MRLLAENLRARITLVVNSGQGAVMMASIPLLAESRMNRQ
jgi:hypothetical protein